MFICEPFLLSKYGTTLGKAIFGLRITKDGIDFLTYREALDRLWIVFTKGEGLYIPIYTLVASYKQYKICNRFEISEWDEDLSYEIKDTKFYRTIIYIGANILIFSLSAIITFSLVLPPNRGDITVSEFSENYNYYVKHFDLGYNQYLNENAQWVDNENTSSSFSTNSFNPGLDWNNPPAFNFDVQDGYVVGVSFDVDIDDENFISSYDNFMTLIGLSLGEGNFFDYISSDFSNFLDLTPIESFSFSDDFIEYNSIVDYKGYHDGDNFLAIDSDSSDKPSFTMSFDAQKLK